MVSLQQQGAENGQSCCCQATDTRRPGHHCPGLPESANGPASQAPWISSSATLTPGPMVELTLTFFTNLPLAPDGLPLMIASMNATKFSLRSPSEKLALPIPAWTIPAF